MDFNKLCHPNPSLQHSHPSLRHLRFLMHYFRRLATTRHPPSLMPFKQWPTRVISRTQEHFCFINSPPTIPTLFFVSPQSAGGYTQSSQAPPEPASWLLTA